MSSLIEIALRDYLEGFGTILDEIKIEDDSDCPGWGLLFKVKDENWRVLRQVTAITDIDTAIYCNPFQLNIRWNQEAEIDFNVKLRTEQVDLTGELTAQEIADWQATDVILGKLNMNAIRLKVDFIHH